MTDKVGSLFGSCQFAFVPSRTLLPKTIAELSRTVQKYGGQALEPDTDGRLRLQEATHIVANSIDFEQYSLAMDKMIPVVTSTWITYSLSRGKPAQMRPFSPDPRFIFSSVNLTCADIPPSDKAAIVGATTALGGMESKDVSRLTTHICALSMAHPKCQEAVTRKLSCKIVLPHWFDDCFKLGKKIDETPYLLPDPPILREPRRKKTGGDDGGDNDVDEDDEDDVPIPDHQDLDGAVSTMPESIPNLDGHGWRSKVTVFQNKKVMLSSDLDISRRFRSIVVGLIRRGGGQVVPVREVRNDSGEGHENGHENGNSSCSSSTDAAAAAAAAAVDACDMFICHYRDGPDYVRAARAGKDIGNLSWLFHVITTNEWCSPLRRLLHYPVPRHGLPGFEDFVITLSNYGGEARIYLENLVVAAGAKFTKTMRMDNTHLITARDNSEKCEAARDWNVQMINHLWIEESYARCEVQSVTSPRYTTFPARTNLGEVIGQTFLDATRLRVLYYPGEEDEDDDDDNDEDDDEDVDRGETGKQAKPTVQAAKAASPQVLADVTANGHTKSNENSIQENGNDEDDEETASEAEEEEEEEKEQKQKQKEAQKEVKAAAKQTPKAAVAVAVAAETTVEETLPRRRAAQQNVSTPSRPAKRSGRQGKENEESPMLLSSASRSAKDKALSKLHGLAPDIALYEKEKKRSVKGPWGGKRAADLAEKERQQQQQSKKRPSPEAGEPTDSEDGAEGSGSGRPAKKARPSLPPVTMRVVLTGYQRWVHSSSKEETERKKLRNLGIQIVQENQACDYLAAPCLVRTMKFLKTLARGPEVIDAQYITDVLEEGKLLAPADYLLKDKEGEERFRVQLSQALARARANRGRLLRTVVVYCMANIKNGCDSYREIAEANGAIFKTYQAHSGTTIRPTVPGKDGVDPNDPCEPVYLLTSAAPAERVLWSKFEQMARAGNMEPRVVAPDWLLDVAMRQEVVFDEHYLATTFFAGR